MFRNFDSDISIVVRLGLVDLDDLDNVHIQLFNAQSVSIPVI